jgi:hypothetical protein
VDGGGAGLPLPSARRFGLRSAAGDLAAERVLDAALALRKLADAGQGWLSFAFAPSSRINHKVVSFARFGRFFCGTRMSIRTLCLSAALLMLPAAAQAEAGRVIGDSIGVGVSWAAKIPSTAKNSVAIYSGAIMEQLHQAQQGETVFMSLGTNDAVGGALDVKAKVAAILAEADRLGVKLVWIGPPCVLKPWEEYAKKLDGILAEQLAGTTATYVSTQGAEFCDAKVHAPEGVHFTMAGYTLMWQKAAAAADFSTVVASAVPAEASGLRVKTKTKRHRHKSHAKRRAETTEKPEKTEAAPQ